MPALVLTLYVGCNASICALQSSHGFHADLHPTDLAHLSLGKVSSLLEIEWIQQARLVCPSLRYYYLGFYLHTCHRMRYKVLTPTGMSACGGAKRLACGMGSCQALSLDRMCSS